MGKVKRMRLPFVVGSLKFVLNHIGKISELGWVQC